jgi:ABC-type transport system involved in multi-copper enzyme maturation permease subunit
MNVMRVAGLTWQEARRARALLAGVVMTTIFLGLYGWGIHAAAAEFSKSRLAGQASVVARMNVDLRPVIWGQALSAGLYGVAGIGALLAIFLGAPAIARDIENGTLQLLASRPLGRWEIVTGKWIGGCALLGSYAMVSGGFACALTWWATGYVPENPLLVVVALAMQSIVLHSLTIALSSALPTIAAGVVAVILHGIVVVAGFGERIGVLIDSQSLKRTGLIASLILPSDIAWQLAASEAQPPNPLSATGTLVPMGPFDVLSAPHPAFVMYAIAYAVVALAVASRNLGARDL